MSEKLNLDGMVSILQTDHLDLYKEPIRREPQVTAHRICENTALHDLPMMQNTMTFPLIESYIP